MIDNPMHAILVEAANEAGWDEESILLQATRFIDHLACQDRAMGRAFRLYLDEQVALEKAEQQENPLAENDEVCSHPGAANDENASVCCKPMLQVVVFRESNDERTCAVVRCRRTDTICDGDSLKAAVVRAVTAWMNETKEGKDALECSSEDFNVGDLCVEAGDGSTLEPYLKKEGVEELVIDTYRSHETDWCFDDRLFDARKLEDGDG